MGLIDPAHLFLVALVALIVIGPRRLPELGRALGRALHEFRDALGEGIEGGGDDPAAPGSDAAASPQEPVRG
jgi:TatA/E family protein of Tat protein translocase